MASIIATKHYFPIRMTMKWATTIHHLSHSSYPTIPGLRLISVRLSLAELADLNWAKFPFYTVLIRLEIAELAIATGCPTGTDIKFTMNARPKDNFHTSHIWQNFHYTCTFWSCVCKNSKAFSIFFKFGRNFDAQILKIWKRHRKLRIKQTSVLFCKYLHNKSSDLYEIWDFYSWDSKEISNDFS